MTASDDDSASSEQLATQLRGRRVQVESVTGQRFEGYLDQVASHDRHVLLQAARELPGGAAYSSAFVPDIAWIVPVGGTRDIVEADLDRVRQGVFAVAEFSLAANSQYIQAVAQRGFLGQFPIVTREADQFIIVEGHKSCWAADQAGLESHPVMVESLSKQAQAVRFAFAHFPLPHDVNGEGNRDRDRVLYTDERLRRSIERYDEELGAAAMDIYPVRFNAERLGLREPTTKDSG